MCSNYRPARRLEAAFPSPPATFEYNAESYPGRRAPILLASDGNTQLQPVLAMFGMVPHWAELALARRTYNCRSETAAQKPSFRSAWRHRQLCLIPVEGFFEPNYESGRPVRWEISRVDRMPFALAGLYETASGKDPQTADGRLWSFTMLTINASDSPLMNRFHAPDDEKRSVVVVPPDRYGSWLDATTDEEIRAHLQLMDPAEFMSAAAPRPPRTKSAGPQQLII